MADNVGYTPGTGEIIATDDVAGVQHQKIKITLGDDGIDDGMVSANNPLPSIITNSEAGPIPVRVFVDSNLPATSTDPIPTLPQGEIVEALEAVRMGVQSLNRTVGQALPDSANRLRVNIEAGTLPTVTTVSTVTTVTTVTTCSTLTNQTQLGGNPAFEQIPALLRLAADALRRNISVT
jgi:hypothetical protein